MDDAHDDEAERREAEERSAPPARVVHAAVAEQGMDELARPVSSLFWSGFAAGIAIMASLWTSGTLHHMLPRATWAEAVVALGYPAGFLIVILGRLQLFTEHTAVAVLPIIRTPSMAAFGRLMRLWVTVLSANLLGAATVSAAVAFAAIQSPEILRGMLDVSTKLLDRSPAQTLLQAIPAGFLIASIAWIRSATEGSGFWVVFAVTYIIGLSGFAHVIAGTTEAFLLAWNGEASIGWAVGGFILPALLGNIVGGTGLFALLAHAQVKNER